MTSHSKEEIILLVNQVIDQYYAMSIAKAGLLHPRYEKLLVSMRTLAMAGGKRMRPYLAVTTYEAYGGTQLKDMCIVGASLELLHGAMLIHDDIIDRDSVRYGINNISGQYREHYKELAGEDAAHFADSAALLAGDITLSASYQLILDSGFRAEQKILAQRLLAEAIFKVCGGELIDTDAALYPPEESDPLLINEIKTAHYSFVTPMLIGAALAGANEDELQKLTSFGMKLGVAFQLADDLLGMFGDEALTGKSSMGDMREGKRTWLSRTAFERASQEQLMILEQQYGNKDLQEPDADRIRQIFIDSGAVEACSQKIEELAAEAKVAMQKLELSHEAKGVYLELIDKTTRRDK
jgi:geranylgeranyl diphosphate synthase type II